MRVSVPQAVLARLDLERAVYDEIADPPRDLPTRVLERAVEDHVDKAASLISGYFQDGIDIPQRETVFVPKARASGRRPIAVMAFPERVLYRALTDSLTGYFDPLDRTFEAREAILEIPRS